MADYVDERLTGLREWRKGQRRHRLTLKAILRSDTSVDNSRPASFTPQSHHLSTKQFHRFGTLHSESTRSIHHSNQHLLKHLLAISLRVSTPAPSPPCRSLNTALRKRQEREIGRDNALLASRVQGRKSYFSAVKWDEDYKKACKYRAQISKPHLKLEFRRMAKTPGPKLLPFPWEAAL